MGLLDLFRSGRRQQDVLEGARGSSESTFGSVAPPATQDTLAAIVELSQLVKNNPDLVEIYLALGNLYRAQGEIERAVQIRNSLIVRPGLDACFKAKAWFELGRDYKRGGFMDRAEHAFNEARQTGGDEKLIIPELATLAAKTGDFERAAALYGQLKLLPQQAHYLTRLAHRRFQAGDVKGAASWLNKASKTYPHSLEVGLAKISQGVHMEQWKKLPALLREAFSLVPDDMRFLLLDGLLSSSRSLQEVASPLPPLTSDKEDPRAAGARNNLCDALLPLLDEGAPDLLLLYYAANLLLECHETERALTYLERALVLENGFWAARLELLHQGLIEQSLTLVFKGQLEFFIEQARQLKKYLCRSCGLKQEHSFLICPRCKSWHSIAFRVVLRD
jgi:lipopolysaccharide biosynthesis regulator YciM